MNQQNQHLEDKRLIQKYIAGDENSFRKLVLKYQQRVFGTIFMIVKNKEIAEDIYQDTMMKIVDYLKSGKYNEEGKFLPWLLMIAKNKSIDYFRSKKRKYTIQENDVFDIFSNVSTKELRPDQEMESKETSEMVKSLIAELPEKQREVLIMRHYSGLSFKEISEITGTSVNTALGRMRYALIKLRKIALEKNIVNE